MILIFAVFACVCVVAAFVFQAWRRLRALDVRYRAAAAAVAAARARRGALLLALMGVVRAFAPQERALADRVAKVHAELERAPSPQARLLGEARLADALDTLLARAQQNPQLGALADFAELRAAFEESGRSLARARRTLAAATADYNAALARFPVRTLALRLKMVPRAFYDVAVEPALSEEMA